jgi:hypothetical protein
MAAPALSDLEGQGLHVRTDGVRLFVGPRGRVTVEVIELVRANRAWLLSLALARMVVQARLDDWIDPKPDVCAICDSPAVGYSEQIQKACAAHLGRGQRWWPE